LHPLVVVVWNPDERMALAVVTVHEWSASPSHYIPHLEKRQEISFFSPHLIATQRKEGSKMF
jgi:hypothetical protein